MKKKLTVLAVLALCLGLAATGTWAYFTAQKQVHNVITTGKVDIRLLEWADADRTQPFENLTGIMPGMEVTKIAEVKNTGTAPAFIRVQVMVDVYSAEGNLLDPAPVKLDFNQTDWIYHEGYYYYNRILNPGETTEPLQPVACRGSSAPPLWRRGRIFPFTTGTKPSPPSSLKRIPARPSP